MRYGWTIVFILAALLLFFFGMSRIPLWSGDEGRYGEIAREMWESKDFILPRFNYVDIFEKPILAPLLTAGSFAVFGVSAWAARLPGIFSALLGLLMTYSFARRFFGPKAATWSAIVLLTSIGYVLMGRFAMIDTLMTFFISVSLFCLMTAAIARKRRYYYLAYAAMGLALVTKGLIGVALPLMVYGVYLAATGNLAEIRQMRLGRGLLIIVLIFIPWGIAISIREPEFSYVFVMKQHLMRFTTGSFGRRRPFWFFLPILLALSFPWSFFLPAAVRDGLKQSVGVERNKILFLVIWAAVIFVFFSIPKSKLPYYILPLSMPLAMLVGIFLDNLVRFDNSGERFKDLKWMWRAMAAVGFMGIVGLNLYLWFWAKDGRALALKALVQPLVPALSLTVLAGGCSVYWWNKQKRTQLAILTLAATVYFCLLVAILGMIRLSPFMSTFDYAQYLKPLLKEADIVAVYASPDHFSDLPFYLERRVVVVGSDRGTLAEESVDADDAQEDKNWFLESGSFVRLFNARESRVFCLLKSDGLDELVRVGLEKYTVLKAGDGKLLISNGA